MAPRGGQTSGRRPTGRNGSSARRAVATPMQRRCPPRATAEKYSRHPSPVRTRSEAQIAAGRAQAGRRARARPAGRHGPRGDVETARGAREPVETATYPWAYRATAGSANPPVCSTGAARLADVRARAWAGAVSSTSARTSPVTHPVTHPVTRTLISAAAAARIPRAICPAPPVAPGPTACEGDRMTRPWSPIVANTPDCHNVVMGHDHDHATGRAEDRARLRIALAVTVSVLVLEVVGALLTGSLALLADAAHMATDAAAVVLALGASYVATRGGGPRSTFGLHRAEILAALVNALVLLVVCGYLAWAGISRLADPASVDAGPMVLVALVGLAANAVSLSVLNRSETGSLNMRGAVNEVFADLLGSVLAVLAGLAILLWGFDRADPIASLVIAALILPRSLVLLRDAAVVLLEVAPAGLDLEDVRRHLLAMPGVVDVHDLHAWTITSGMPSLSAHVTVSQAALDEHGVGGILDRLCECTAEHFDVRHSTFQVEPETHREHEDLGEVH